MKLQGTKAPFRVVKSLFTLLLAGIFQNSMADVIVTPASGGQEISADRSAGSGFLGFTPIGTIQITEQDVKDFAITGRYWRTMVLTAPEGWEFNPGSGQAMHAMPTDFRVIDLKVDARTISIRFCVKSADYTDVLTICGIEVRSLHGNTSAVPAYIHRSADNPGTAMVSNIKMTRHALGAGGTNFATLSLKPGQVQKLVFNHKPFAGAEAESLEGITEIITADQFGNPSTEGLADYMPVTIRSTTVAVQLQKPAAMNIGMAGGKGRILVENLKVNGHGMTKLTARAPGIMFAVTNPIYILPNARDGREPESMDPDFICKN